MSEAKILSKISLKGIGAQPKPRSLKEGDKIELAAIYGSASKHDTVPTTYGDSTRFFGSFEAVNLATGEVFRAGRAFLPGVVEDILVDAINSLDVDASNASVDFAFKVGAEYSEKGNTGYQYTVQPLVKLAESDQLAHLRDAVQAELKSLPAPEAKTEKKAGKK